MRFKRSNADAAESEAKEYVEELPEWERRRLRARREAARKSAERGTKADPGSEAERESASRTSMASMWASEGRMRRGPAKWAKLERAAATQASQRETKKRRRPWRRIEGGEAAGGGKEGTEALVGEVKRA